MFGRPLARDAGFAALLAGTSLLIDINLFVHSPLRGKIITQFGSEAALQQHMLWWWLAAIPALVGLVLRRQWPLLAFLLTAVSSAAHQFDQPLSLQPIDFAPLITLYSLASLGRSRRVGAVALVGTLIGFYAVCLVVELGIGLPVQGKRPAVLVSLFQPSVMLMIALSSAAIPALLLGIAWALGDNARTRRLHLATVEQRTADLERERDQRAALAVAAERARVTRELHDVVAHGLSVIVVQAQGAAAALQRHPERTATALATVIDTGRASLAEMRRLLGIVRRNLDHSPQLAPQPGLGALPALVDQIRAAGTPVALHVDGQPVPLPAGVDLSAFRIVQEALTNTLKHAGADTSVTVRVAFHPTELEIDVTDNGAGPAQEWPPTDGNGLHGISERVDILGGSVVTGPGLDHGFRVHALLPIGADQ